MKGKGSEGLIYRYRAHTFHAADGTTGNFLTGVYTLADGRVGNMYYGPYPTNSKGVAAVTTTGSGGGVPTTVIASQVTVTVVSTPGGSLATSPAITSQQGVVSSKVGKSEMLAGKETLLTGC